MAARALLTAGTCVRVWVQCSQRAGGAFPLVCVGVRTQGSLHTNCMHGAVVMCTVLLHIHNMCMLCACSSPTLHACSFHMPHACSLNTHALYTLHAHLEHTPNTGTLCKLHTYLHGPCTCLAHILCKYICYAVCLVLAACFVHTLLTCS